jgi:uncharacterized protein YegL
MEKKLPGGRKTGRPLHFIWMCDCSGSMAGDKIETLNYAIHTAIPAMRSAADANPNAEVFVRCITFADGAQWQISQPTPVEAFAWTDLSADGVTDMGKALAMVADQLKLIPTTERGLPPVLVLVSDGQPTDDFNGGLKALMDQPWGEKAVRIGIAIGQDADLGVIQKFIGHPELKPLRADNAETLVRYIKWASTAGIQVASAPRLQTAGAAAQAMYVPIPTPPDPVDDDVVF